MAGGFIHSQVLASCVRLGLLESLRHGARPVASIADRAGLPRERAEYLLRAAAALRLLEARPGDRFGLGPLGAAMIDNPSILALIEHHERLYRDLNDPVRVFRGEIPSDEMESLWPYATSDTPGGLTSDSVRDYTELMAASQAMVADQVLGAFSFGDCRTLLDIGGGSGAFLSAVHERWPALRLTLADLPGVAEIARENLRRSGLGDEIAVIGADVKRDPLPTGFDVVSLVRILHDHDDPMVETFLGAAHGALREGGTLLIAEPLAGRRGAGPLIDAYFNVYLMAMGSGRPRRFGELAAFLERAGFSDVRRVRTRIPLITSLITARATS